MERITKSKSKSQYLSLLVKKISNDRLSKKEIESYNLLKVKVDPQGELEDELSSVWKTAEQEDIANSINRGISQTSSKFSMGIFFRL